MAHTLSTHEIARMVGSQAFSRGERYARNGHVTEQSWFGDGTQLFGTVEGTSSQPYSVTVSFTVNSVGLPVRASGVCTCPMKNNCKHVAALLIASATNPAKPSALTPSGTRSLGERRMPTFEPTDRPTAAEPPAAPPVAAWQAALGPLARPADPNAPVGTALALQFDVLPPAPRSARLNASRPPEPSRLGARPMLMGKKGKWIRGTVTWDNLAWTPGSFAPEHRRVLNALYALYSAGQRYYTYTEHWIHLDTFGNRALWELLNEAQSIGLPLVSATANQLPVTISETPAALELDIHRAREADAGGLVLTPTLTVNEQRLNRSRIGFIGEPAHGIFTWTGGGDPARGAGSTSSSSELHLTLAPLAHPVSAQMRALATAAEPLVIPAADEPAFLSDYYPFLRQQLTLTSSDGSFDLPQTPRPVLSVAVTHLTDARIELAWDWQYCAPLTEEPVDTVALAPRPAPALYRHTLRASARDTDFRDDPREAQILRELSPLLAPFPGLTPLPERVTLDGAGMIAFLGDTVPALEATGDVRVSVSADAPQYRPADEAPVIRLATTERADDRDWFDLAVTISIDGEEIPFDELFRALATEQELMILESGTYFSLDRPELHDLRRLIDEARGLQESGSDSLGISRFQSDLWEELQMLGVVAAQAKSWRSAIEGLTDATRIDERPLSPSVHATLRGYQQTGFDWLSFLFDHRLGGILADDMGLGKTLQAIALITHARDTAGGSGRAPFLVVAPTSVVSNWAAECARFAPDLVVAAITETSRKRGGSLADIAAGADVVITSYTLFRLDFDEYNDFAGHEGSGWAGLLLDEAQFVKNHQSRAHVCARRLKTPFKLAITGTPMENNLMELWSLLSITAPGLFPSPSRFTDYYRKPIETDGDSERLAQLRRRIRPFMLRRTKDEVASDLPAKQEQVLELELHPKHRKVYDTHLARERQKVLGLIDDMNANRFEIFRSLTMLRQLSLDASLYDEKYAAVPSTKLDALLELLEDTVAEGHRTLIFSQFTQYLGKARDRLDAAGISYSYLDGKTRNRARAINDFKTGSSSVFLISLKAGGFGLNLTEADYVVLLDPWWNPATEAQAVDRVHRIGQTKNVMVYRLVSKDTIEEKVMALKATKAKLFESVMTDGAAAGSALTAADIRELLG
ncbi:helicase [Cryobacterium frigoriphilum]|uniref:Helicase n=1 Tax=Cryobacterium frigoriphilum TaxID=1259150 RepID=A0A4R8ZWG0_9MICO|nr:SNF2-related protein [Cryobacterium frigoriphilum]TFD47844.1 helicase [Cryobacterium frigoriphilum]